MARPVWRSEKRKIAELIPSDFNPREMNEKENSDLKASIDAFGLVSEVIINANNTIIGGHQRVRLLRGSGAEEVDVRCPDRLLDKNEELELALRLNKNQGRFNFDDLVNADEAVLLKVGFNQDELEGLFENEAAKDDGFKLILKFDTEAEFTSTLERLGVAARAGARSKTVAGVESIKTFGDTVKD